MHGALRKTVPAALLAVCAASWLLPGGGFGSPAVVEVPPPLHEGTPWARFLAPDGACPGDTSISSDDAKQLHAMRCLLDWARRERGLPAIPMNPLLVESSRLKAHAIVRCGDFSHTPAGATSPRR